MLLCDFDCTAGTGNVSVRYSSIKPISSFWVPSTLVNGLQVAIFVNLPLYK